LTLLLLAFLANSPATLTDTCLREISATSTVNRLSDLPQDVRSSLSYFEENILKGRIADSGSPLMQTDAPSAIESGYPRARFSQAVLIRDRWFVQFQVSLWSGVRTVSFTRSSDGRYGLSPGHYFGGPACESLKAAVAGVSTPGGF
jgi:hypothetical protein